MSVLPKQLASTIDKTLLTSMLLDGFWERWIAHGVTKEDLIKVRQRLNSLEQWVELWGSIAKEKENHARLTKDLVKKESLYQQAGFIYSLIQWIYPERNREKVIWYMMSKNLFRKADSLSSHQTKYIGIEFENCKCNGRIRIPNKNKINAKGCILIINPIDSAKEELYKYENDFVNAGFVTFCFDGPGQGETYALQELKGTRKRWESFINKLIELAHIEFPNLPIYLFGTSSGASWAIYGSIHPYVVKTVAVSPAFVGYDGKHHNLPEYFIERMNKYLETPKDILPIFEDMTFNKPLLLFHGEQDVMVDQKEVVEFVNHCANVNFFTYEDQGHCCNDKLNEIRKISIDWYKDIPLGGN